VRRVLDPIDLRERESIRMYPCSDGKPMGESTLQIHWIMMFYTNLTDLFAGQDVFVAADLFWYPVEGKPKIVTAPDILVALDRPNHHRVSYRQWVEENVPPQVVIEILSENNNDAEMKKKKEFFRKYGVEEYYIFDPPTNTVEGFLRRQNQFRAIYRMDGWQSPRLGIRFDLSDELVVRRPDGTPFKTISELRREALDRQEEYLKKDAEARRERRRANASEKEAESLSKQAEAYRQKLRELGIDPDTLK
jgi:Uma2 family endonuclease